MKNARDEKQILTLDTWEPGCINTKYGVNR